MSTILKITAGSDGLGKLPCNVIEAFDTAEVTQTDEGPSGFQLTFKVGRNKTTGLDDYQTLTSNYFRVFNRVIITVEFDGEQTILIDGLITHHQLNPSSQPGMSSMTITGEDLSVLMDLEEKATQFPDQSDPSIVDKILAEYSEHGIKSKVTRPKNSDPVLKTDWCRTQIVTDREYLSYLAKWYGFDFYIVPGPEPGQNTAYWGEPKRTGLKQNAISVNMKQWGNADQVNFQFDALAPEKIKMEVSDRNTDKMRDVKAESSEVPTISDKPAIENNQRKKLRLLRDNAGLSYAEALARAQGELEGSVKETVIATGQLNGFRYRGVLQARALVALRGAGHTYDGEYYVKSVTHRLRRGEYSQSYVLNREGTLTTTISVKV
jgi:hypothetical protein